MGKVSRTFQKKFARLHVYCPPSEYKMIHSAAKKNGVAASLWARLVLRSAARKALGLYRGD